MPLLDESFPTKCFKSNKMINRAMPRPEPILHISEQILGFMVRDKLTDNHLFHGFTDATYHGNKVIVGRICWIFTRLRNRNDLSLCSNLKESHQKYRFYKEYLKLIKKEKFGKCFKN